MTIRTPKTCIDLVKSPPALHSKFLRAILSPEQEFQSSSIEYITVQYEKLKTKKCAQFDATYIMVKFSCDAGNYCSRRLDVASSKSNNIIYQLSHQ